MSLSEKIASVPDVQDEKEDLLVDMACRAVEKDEADVIILGGAPLAGLAGAGLVAAGFADFPLIAYHFQKTSSVPQHWVPIAYAVAMAVSGAGSLVFGRLFDRFGIAILIPLTIVSALFAPLVFLGGFWAALLGAALWGIGMGVHESIVPAAVAPMVSRQHRASAYGLFTAGYGVCWFIGSALIGILYDRSLAATIVFCVALQLAAIPLFVVVRKQADAMKAAT